MHFKKSSDSFPISGNRFETTYGNSYNRSYNYPGKPISKKFPENNYQFDKSDDNSKLETHYSLPVPKPIDKISYHSPLKPANEPITPSDPYKSVILKTTDNAQLYPPKPEPFRQFDYNHMITQIAKITDNLFLSSLHAITADRLKHLGITLVVSLIAEHSLMRLPSTVQRLQVNIEDTENVNIRRHFDKVLERMNLEERRQGRILVHCVAGISRSSTIVLAYLMRHHNMRLREAYELVHVQRPYVQPNLGFWRQLIDYERSIFGSSTVNMVPMEGSRILIPDVRPSILSEILSVTPMLRMQPRSPATYTSF